MARGRTAEEIREASPVLLEAAVDNRFFRRNETRTLPAFGGGELLTSSASTVSTREPLSALSCTSPPLGAAPPPPSNVLAMQR